MRLEAEHHIVSANAADDLSGMDDQAPRRRLDSGRVERQPVPPDAVSQAYGEHDSPSSRVHAARRSIGPGKYLR